MDNKERTKEKAKFWGRILGKALDELVALVFICLAFTFILELLKYLLGKTIAYAIMYGLIISLYFLSYVWLQYQKAIKKDDENVVNLNINTLNMAQVFLNKSTGNNVSDDDKEHLINLASGMYWYWERYDKNSDNSSLQILAVKEDKE